MRERPWFDFWWMRQQRKLKDQQQTSRERERWAMWPVRSNVIREVEEVIWHWTSAGAQLYIHIRTVTKSPKSFPRNWGWENEIQKRISGKSSRKTTDLYVTSPGCIGDSQWHTTRLGPECFCFASLWVGWWKEGIIYIPTNQNSRSQGYARLQIGE